MQGPLVEYENRGVSRSFDLNFGNPTLGPFRFPLRLFDQFDKADANALSPLLAASFEFSRHHGTPSESTANVSLFAFHQLISEKYDHSGFPRLQEQLSRERGQRYTRTGPLPRATTSAVPVWE